MGILSEQLAKQQYPDWSSFFEKEQAKPYFPALDQFVTARCAAGPIYPPPADIFNAFAIPPDKIRVVILGQDPYHERGEAMGLSFSVREGVKAPPTLRNINKELADDLGVQNHSTDFTPWVQNGVFLLNTVLTVDDGHAFSHAGQGWELFVDAALRFLCTASDAPLATVLWGAAARSYAPLFTQCAAARPLLIVESAHPSPLSAYRGFFGSKPFSRIDAFLRANGCPAIPWQL